MFWKKKLSQQKEFLLEMHTYNGSEFMRNEQYDEAVVEFGKALEISKGGYALLCNLGTCYMQVGAHDLLNLNGVNKVQAIENFEKAEAYFLRSIKENKGNSTSKDHLEHLRQLRREYNYY